jgi:hypothetical protein
MRQTIASAAVVGLCIIVAGIAAGLLIGGRYQLAAANGAAIRLDRLTGSVVACDASKCADVVPPGPRADPWAVAKTQTNVR